MSIFDWLQIALGFVHVVRRTINRAASLLGPYLPRQCATTSKALEDAE
jgi:hypothetical protein